MAAADVRATALEHLVAQVRDHAIVALDPQGVVETWNLGAERLTGYAAGETIGRSFAMLHPEGDQRSGKPMLLLERARETGRAAHAGWRVRKDGTQFWGDAVITALHDESGMLTGYAQVIRDLTAQHALEERLRRSEQRLRLLVGQVVDYAIIALDPQGVIESWNRGAERVKGYTTAEAIGRSFAMFYPEEDRRRVLPMRLLMAARRDGHVEHTGWRVRKDGTQFWGDVVITALHDDDGRLTGYAKVTRDRTDLKRLEEAQDAFYAAFSHDFRTPLAALRAYVESIRHADDDAEREMLVDRAEANAERLLEMVEGLVEFARHRDAQGALEIGPVDLADLARQTVLGLSHDLHPERVVVGDGDARVLGDRAALRRVVTNLLVNALRYSADCEPVHVDVVADEDGRVALVVADRGRGIAADDLDTVFEQFQRGRLAEDDGGSGLGLTSVRDLVQQQGGTVEVASEVGRGTTMRVLLRAAGPAQSLSGSAPTGQSAG